MVFKNRFDVCVKKFDSVTSINAITSILTSLNTGDFTPHCFGISINMRALVMSYIVIDCLLCLAKALEYIHSKKILHNDLKHDNIVLGHT